MDDATAQVRVFVYGTLKQGQRNVGWWPHEPIEVNAGYTFGQLFDLGAYPAMIAGKDRVAGEVWSFQKHHAAATIAALDKLEDFRGSDDDEYRRESAEVYLLPSHEKVSVQTYYYNRTSELSLLQPLKPIVTGFCSWKAEL